VWWAKEIERPNVLQAHFDSCNRSHPISRAVVGLCYFIGGAILLVPSADIFLRVSRVLFREVVRHWFG
jgi:hypothetical protein